MSMRAKIDKLIIRVRARAPIDHGRLAALPKRVGGALARELVDKGARIAGVELGAEGGMRMRVEKGGDK